MRPVIPVLEQSELLGHQGAPRPVLGYAIHVPNSGFDSRDGSHLPRSTRLRPVMVAVEQCLIRDAAAREAELAQALLACIRAMRDVQDHGGDPGSWVHNRLLTPMLVYEGVIVSVQKFNK